MARREGAVGLELLAKGILQQDEERRQFRQKVELALAEKQIESMFPEQVYDIDESGNLRKLGNVPHGAKVIRDRQFSPLDQLRQGIMQSQMDISRPDILETQINQLGQTPGSEQQIGGLQQQYGQSILKQQQAQAQFPALQEQAKVLQQAGLLTPSIYGTGGGLEQFINQTSEGVLSDTVTIQLPDGSIATVPRRNLSEALRRGAKLIQ